MVIVHNLETAHELLSKRANLNGTRTVGYMFSELYVHCIIIVIITLQLNHTNWICFTLGWIGSGVFLYVQPTKRIKK
jgi:hypothetical protein